jgi:drug/metabolite transporter (DMT)-like permease
VNHASARQSATYALTALVALGWGLNYVAAKLALRCFPPLLLATLRMVLAGLLMSALYAWWSRRVPHIPFRDWPRRDLLWMAIVGMLGMAGNQVLFVAGLGRTSVAHAALIVASQPMLVLLLAWLRGQERLTPRKLGGLILAACGIGALHLIPAPAGRQATLAGDLLCLGCSLAFALYTVFTKETMHRYVAMPLTALGYAASALMLAAPVAWSSARFPYARVTGVSWAALLYMVAISSVACYIVFAWALGRLPASRVGA